MPQTQDMTPHPITVNRHGADLSLCYSLMWNVTLEYTATHFNVLGQTRPGNTSLTFHTPANPQLCDTDMVVVSWKLGRNYRTNRVLNPGAVVCESITLSARPQPLPSIYEEDLNITFTTSIKGKSFNLQKLAIDLDIVLFQVLNQCL